MEIYCMCGILIHRTFCGMFILLFKFYVEGQIYAVRFEVPDMSNGWCISAYSQGEDILLTKYSVLLTYIYDRDIQLRLGPNMYGFLTQTYPTKICLFAFLHHCTFFLAIDCRNQNLYWHMILFSSRTSQWYPTTTSLGWRSVWEWMEAIRNAIHSPSTLYVPIPNLLLISRDNASQKPVFFVGRSRKYRSRSALLVELHSTEVEPNEQTLWWNNLWFVSTFKCCLVYLESFL